MAEGVVIIDRPTADARHDRAWADRQPGEPVAAWRHRTRSFVARDDTMVVLGRRPLNGQR